MKEGLVEAVGNESFEYEVPSAYKAMLTPYEGKKVILGVRPEDIEIKKATGKKSGGTLVNCDYVELLGYDLMVYAYILGNKVVVKSEENTGIAMGDDGYITFKEDAVYFFDGETEQRIR
ncbi:MAG: hypothetical protein MJ239_02090 [Bacilli bacterium]|nr:hypothetical protein [Bacilli bacterium]